MKIKSILSALLLMASTVASAQYLNVKMEDGTYRSFKTTPNMKVSFGDKAGAEVTESVQTVIVGGHKVSVKLAEDILTSDISLKVYTEGEMLKINVFSMGGYELECSRDDNGMVTESDVSNGFYTFTLSNISKDMVATVKYKFALCTVKFFMNGREGTAPADMKVESGKTFTPPIPKAAFSTLCGWYDEDNCTTLHDFSQPVTADMVLYAKWTDGINGHAYVELAGYKWGTENIGKCEVKKKLGPDIEGNGWGCYFYYFDRYVLSAAESWGSEGDYSWTLPSSAQWQALIDGCDWTWTVQDGKAGYKVSDKNDSSKFIFLPAAGFSGVNATTQERTDYINHQGKVGSYSSATGKIFLLFDNEGKSMKEHPSSVTPYKYDKYDYQSVRPVVKW